MKFKSLFILLLWSIAQTASASARVEMSEEFKAEVSQDFQENFAERLSTTSILDEENAVLSAKDQKVMLKTLYVGVEGPLSLAGIHLSEQSFYQKVGKLLGLGARYGVLPSAITIGYFKRADLMVGATYATEMNFYLDQGNLRVSTYDMKSINVGVMASVKMGYYVALCFGACTGGDAQGSYIGIDADVIFGVGANIYVEVGVDTTDYYKAKKIGEKYKMSDLYDTKVVYIGAGIDVGFGGGISFGFSEYDLKSDNQIMDLYSIMNQPNFNSRVKSAFDRASLFKSGPRLH